MTSPQGIATADSLTYNFETGRGGMTNGHIEMPGLAYLSGTEIEMFGESSYQIVDGRFTSCAGETPTWSFGAQKIDVELGNFAQAKHVKFYLFDIPVLYLPYLVFPANAERSSGFLMPTVDFSSQRGTQVVIPWYQVISQDQDITLTLDSMSQLGIGTGFEYRYFNTTVRPAKLAVNYITGVKSEPDRYLLEWQHDGFLPADTRLVINSQYVNRNDYFELFGGSSQEYTSDKVQSDLYLSKLWGKTNLTGLVHYTRALQQSNAAVLQTLPEIGLSVTPQRFMATPLITALDVELTNFWRRVGDKGTRFRFNPSLSTDMLSSRYLAILPTVAWREQLYRIGGSSYRAGRPEMSVSVGNRFARIYRQSADLAALRHTVEFQLNYLYAPAVDTTDITPFDFLDDLSALNRLRLTFDNRWTGRQKSVEGISTYRDLVHLRLSVDYDLYEQRRTLYLPSDSHRPFSPLFAELEIRPHDRVYLRSDVALALEDRPGRMDALAIWGGVNDQAGNGLLLNYSYKRTEFDFISVSADLALLAPLYANYEGRFNLQDRKNLDYRTSLEYRSGCWSIATSWYERPGDRTLSISFSLSNITGKRIPQLTDSLVGWF
jgi:LPS-assembly protein